MASTHIKLVSGDTLHVEMSAEDLKAAISGAGGLARLPTAGGHSIYVNPAHIATAWETSDEGILVEVYGG